MIDAYQITQFPLPDHIQELVTKEDWNNLDQEFKKYTQKSGSLFTFLQKFGDFNSIEFIISIRDSENPDEEDGIWHDDGSRSMAFSLSLTSHSIAGGVLELKHQSGQPHYRIPTPPYSEMIVFLTGVHGYLHKINRVTGGKRIIVAGWCS